MNDKLPPLNYTGSMYLIFVLLNYRMYLDTLYDKVYVAFKATILFISIYRIGNA